MKQELVCNPGEQQHQKLVTNTVSANSADIVARPKIEGDLFQFRSTDDTITAADNIISTYISSTNSSLEDLYGSLLLKNVSLEVNIAFPASAT